MNHRSRLRTLRTLIMLASGALAAACQTNPPYDYTNFRAHPPRSVLVLPPLNESTAVQGTYGYLSTVTQPLAERGYYVFPVEVVDKFLKENGMPTPGEMHQVPLEKAAEIFGADAILFLTLQEYGSKYQVFSATTTVSVTAKLVDTRTSALLWDGVGYAQQGSSSSGGLIADLIGAALSQVINSKMDTGHGVSRLANQFMFNKPKAELPYGPYNPKYGQPP